MKKAYEETDINAIGMAIQNLALDGATYKVSEMADAITSKLEKKGGGGGITPSGTKTITANGTYDVTTYASAEVNVPTPTVNYQEKTITENGTYTADSGFDALSRVIVNVAGGGGGFPWPYEVGEYVVREDTKCSWNLVDGASDPTDYRKTIEHHMGVEPNMFIIYAMEKKHSNGQFVFAYKLPPHIEFQSGQPDPSINYVVRTYCANYASVPRTSGESNSIEFTDTTITFGHVFTTNGASSSAMMYAGTTYKWIAMRIPWLD